MLDTDVADAWNCDCCKKLIYNLEDGKPAPGAPPPRRLSKRYEKVCVLCYDLGHVFDNNQYFLALQTEWEDRQVVKK